MSVRHYRPGDEVAQVGIFNTATAGLPKHKPATAPEVLRRVRARDFDPTSQLYAEEQGKVVGYVILNANGRLGYPWCLPGHEACRDPLFQAALAGLTARGVRRAFTAYRHDWAEALDFFGRQGFRPAREMVNFYVNFFDLPTPSNQPRNIAPLRPEETPQVFDLAPGVVRAADAEALKRHLFNNPYIEPASIVALRSKVDNQVVAVSLVILDVRYADPEAIDSFAPCFRNGAFGTEGMNTKRVNGLFSFLARPDRALNALGLEMLGHAAYRAGDADTANGLAAQVASDAGSLFEFYQKYFRRQGSFPVLEKALA